MDVYQQNHHSMLSVSGDGNKLGVEPDCELTSLFGDDEDEDLASLFTEDPCPATFDDAASSDSLAGWSWMAPRSSVFPTFSLPSQEETALASPSLPCEEVQIHQHDQVSTQNPAVDEQIPSETELEMELELELALQEESNIDSPQAETVQCHDVQACHGKPVEQVATGDVEPERPKRRPAIRSSPLLPARIDLECPNIEALLPCINLTTGMTNDKIFESLGLDKECGSSLMTHAKEYLAQPKHAIDIVGPQDPDYRRKIKTAVIEAALRLLVVESWGEKWFSSGPFRSQGAELLWPKDSTEIFYRLIPMLYKLARNAKQRQYAARTREQKISRTAAKRSSTPSTPGSSAAPSPEPGSFMTQSLTLRDGSHPVESMHYASIRTRRSPWQPETTDNHSEEPPSKKTRRDETVAHIEAGTPDIPRLTYTINVMEGTRRLVPALTLHSSYGSHTPTFYDLLTRVTGLGMFGIIEVYTAEGPVPTYDEKSWNEAIQAIYADESMDRMVRVRIRIVEPIILDL